MREGRREEQWEGEEGRKESRKMGDVEGREIILQRISTAFY